MSVCCGYVCECRGLRGLEEYAGSPEVGVLESVLSCLSWVLGTKLRLEEQCGLSIAEPSLQPSGAEFKNMVNFKMPAWCLLSGMCQ